MTPIGLLPAAANTTVTTDSTKVLIDIVANRGFKKVLLVTGTKSFGWFEASKLVRHLAQISEVTRWVTRKPFPDVTELEAGLALAKSNKPDLIIGIGGGTVLDLAKLLAALTGKHTVATEAIRRGSRFDHRNVGLALCPTTAGSGAEATHFAVLYHDNQKNSITGRALVADHVVLDPEPLKTLPRDQIAASGLDALCQCIESIWSNSQTVASRRVARKGLQLLQANLVRFFEGDESRADAMQLGSHLSGKAINMTKTTGPHSLSYYLTSEFQVPHGIAVASTIGLFLDHHNHILDRTPAIVSPAFRDGMRIINSSLGTGDANSGTIFFNLLFSQLGLEQPDHYWPKDAEGLAGWSKSANPERRANHPTSYPKIGGVWF